MRTKRLSKRLTAIVLAVVLAVSLVPVMGESVAVHAEPAFVKDMTNTWLGTEGITDPVQPTSAADPWNGSYVYFGYYNDGYSAIPVKYRVLAKDTDMFSKPDEEGNKVHTMFLDCDSVLFNKEFDKDSFAWAESELNEQLNGSYLSSLPYALRSAIAESYSDAHEYTSDSTKVNAISSNFTYFHSYDKYAALNGEKIFVLDLEDVSSNQFGYRNTPDAYAVRRKTNLRGTASNWWLRTGTTSKGAYISVLSYNNYGFVQGELTPENEHGVSPALNLKLSSILFSSLADEANKEYKLTLINTSDCYIIYKGVSVTGNTFTVNYEVEGDPDGYNRKSVFITDKEWEEGNTNNAELKYYDELNYVSDGIGTFDLPDDLDISGWGTDYHIYITTEKGNTTPIGIDYACKPVEVKRINVSGITLDETEITVAIGSGDDITAIITSSDASCKNVTWTSSDDSIVHITPVDDTSCSFSANGVGTVVITATANNGTADTSDDKTATCTVKVVPDLSEVSLAQTELTLLTGYSEKLDVIIEPEGAEIATYEWLSGNTDVATVDENGIVTAIAEGSTYIQVTATDISSKFDTASCTLTVKPKTDASIIKEVKLTGIMEPDAPKMLDYNSVVIDTLAYYTVKENSEGNNVTWYYKQGDSWIPAGENAEYGTVYKAMIELEMLPDYYKNGSAFAKDLSAKFYDKAVDSVTVSSSGKSAVISVVFPKTALATPDIKCDETKEVFYTPNGFNIPALGWFSGVPDGATVTYSVENFSGEGNYSDGVFKITKCGEFKVVVNTSATDKYEAATKYLILKVIPKTIENIILSATSFTYDGTEKKPAVTVKDGDLVIPASEYTVIYPENPMYAGTYEVRVVEVENGNYTFNVAKNYTIAKVDFPDAEKYKPVTISLPCTATVDDLASELTGCNTEGKGIFAFENPGAVKLETDKELNIGIKFVPVDTINYNKVTGLTVSVIIKHNIIETSENEISATCTTDGSIEFVTKCSICGHEYSRVKRITEKATGHVAGEAVKENIQAANCSKEGSYDLVTYCVECGTEISREHKTTPKTTIHNVGDWETIKAATATEAGTKIKKCKECGEILETETIPATGDINGSSGSGSIGGGSISGGSGSGSGSVGSGTAGGSGSGSGSVGGGTAGGSGSGSGSVGGGTAGGAGTGSGSVGGGTAGGSGSGSGSVGGGTAGGSGSGSGSVGGGTASGSGTGSGSVGGGTAGGTGTGSGSVGGSVVVPTSSPTPTSAPEIEENKVKKGTIIKDALKKNEYIVTSVNTAAPEVAYHAVLNKNAKSVSIPKTVKISGVTYKVTGISDNAFKGNGKLKKVTIGANVTKIGKNAFYGCKALTELVIPKNVKTIGKNAFNGCSALQKLTIKTRQLTTKTVSKGAFKGIPKKCKIVIPEKKADAYKTLLKAKGLKTIKYIKTSKKI